MIMRNFYLNIIIRILVILAASAFAGYFISSGQSYLIPVFCLLVDILMTASLFSYINQTNREIAFFLMRSGMKIPTSLSLPTKKTEA